MSNPRNIVLGVNGSIAAYKAADLTSQLTKAGCAVNVVLTADAQKFVTPLAFKTLSRRPVITDLYDEEEGWKPAHIRLADEADLLLIAPATANCLAKLAHGIADDALTCIALALNPKAGLLIAPFAVVIMGVLTEIVFLRPIYKADPLYQLLLTYGLVLIFGDLVKLIWGADNESVARPAGLEGTIPIFGALFPSYQVFVLIPIGIATILALYLLLNHTQVGNIVRAATQDREMVGALGINVRLLYTGVFAVGAFLGALAARCWRRWARSIRAWISTSSSRSSWWLCWAAWAAWREPRSVP
ncbi:MAG: hypothetical protein HC814_04760 [Rhodobacteraceae bacterium]|nr:hypothetical protein [Paracoccaceae bacterium]